MTALLFFKPFFERFHEFIKAAQCFDLSLFFSGQMFFSQLFKPIGWNVDGIEDLLRRDCFKP